MKFLILLLAANRIAKCVTLDLMQVFVDTFFEMCYTSAILSSKGRGSLFDMRFFHALMPVHEIEASSLEKDKIYVWTGILVCACVSRRSWPHANQAAFEPLWIGGEGFRRRAS